MPAVTRSLVTSLVLGTSITLVGCSSDPAERTVGVVYCTSPLVDHDVERVEYRQDGEVVASTELEVGQLFRAEVPADGRTEIYVDGRLVGSAGDDDPAAEGSVAGGWTALRGEGCPEYVEP